MLLLQSCAQAYAEVFFFNDTATTEIYTLSLHDALPIYGAVRLRRRRRRRDAARRRRHTRVRDHQPGTLSPATDGGVPSRHALPDRKSTRLNSSHANISYAVFCLKKKSNSISPQFPIQSS